MWDDVKLALRSLSKTPGLSLLAIGSLALGISACTIAFSLVDAVAFRPLPFHSTDDLAVIQVFERGVACLRVCRSGLTQPELDDWRHSLGSSDALAVIRLDPAIVSDQVGTAIGEGAAVTANFFALLGIRPSRGRLLDSYDERAGSGNVVILSDAFWRTRYGADPSVLGRTLKLDSTTFQIVGILPPDGLVGRPLFNADTITAQFFVPLKQVPAAPDRSDIDPEVLLARLRPGARLIALRAEVAVALARADLTNPLAPGASKGRTSLVLSLRTAHAQAVDAGSYTLFLAIVALVLALVCANVAGVFLSRLHTRHHELQIRTALGCSAARLTRYCAAEGVLCAVFGGLFGVASTPPILKLSRLLPRFSVPFWTPIVVDYRALACAVALVILTAGLVGVAPAIAIRRHLARMPWREVSVTLPANRRLFVQRLLLIACQMQITIVLLTAAGLLSKTFVDAETRDLGMAKRSVLIVRLATVNATRRLTVGEQEDLCARFLHRLREIPGIVSAAARLSGPLAEGIRREGSPRFLTASLPVAPDLVTAAFFRTWSIPIVEGRAFTDHDSSTETRVTILDKETAERLFPDGHPVGQRVSLGDSASGGVPLTVVGVVGSMKGSVFANESASFYPTLYLPLAQGRPAASQLTFIIRTRGSTSAVEPFVRAAVHEVAPDFPVVSLASFASELGARTAGARLNAAVVGALAIVALIIASLGVFASVSHLVASRTREAGVRLALGAPGAHVLWTMMRPSAIATGVGVAGGIVGALAATRLIRGFLYGESPSDPTAFMFAILALTSAALLAAYIPARRLLRIDPSSALRST